jgi:hypothetical protein
VNDELERMWKEMAVEYFMILYRHLPGVIEKKLRKTSSMISGLRAEI